MPVNLGFATKDIEHVVPVDTHVPMPAKLPADGQAALDGCAIFLTHGCPLGAIQYLHSYLPRIGKMGCGGYPE